MAGDAIAKSLLVRTLPEERLRVMTEFKTEESSNRCSNEVSDAGTTRSSIIAAVKVCPSLIS